MSMIACLGSSRRTAPRVLVAAVLLVGCAKRPDDSGAASALPSAAEPASAKARRQPQLPPEPPAGAAKLASEVPDLEAKLAKDPVYASLWDPKQRDRLIVFLTAVSQLLMYEGLTGDARTTKFTNKEGRDAAVKLFLIHSRVNRYPDSFTTELKKHLAAVRGEPNLGVWSAPAEGRPQHDFAALAAWLHQDDPAYMRELIAARKSGPDKGWLVPRDAPDRPYLVNEKAALERLGLLTDLTEEESSRLAALVVEAKKPKQPKRGEEFRLGDFTYAVKDVKTDVVVGSGFAQKRASEGARFVMVSFSIRNEGMKTETVLSDDFRIVDAQGREFRPSSDANAALVMSGGKDLVLSELQPGLTKQMVTAFEMPAAAADGVFTLVIPEKGLGSKTVRITLK